MLGGTVSAGAYTAGALDFLFQALDDFSLAKGQGIAPQHNVTLKVIAGTSGGGVNAAIAARALAYDYPPITSIQAAGDIPSANPFFDVWVNMLTLDRLLAPNGGPGPVTALMNPEPIDAAAARIVSLTGDRRARDWIAAPLDVFVTMTNLRGVPFNTDLGSGLGQSFSEHADHARFRVRYPHQAEVAARPDSFAVDFNPAGAAAWTELGEYACATAAFPIGFPARPLTRRTDHYRYRATMLPIGPNGEMQPGMRLPDWNAMIPPGAADVPDSVTFLCMDGGATNNQPIEMARVAMAGIGKANPRDGLDANRAVWLIDPFAAAARLGPADEVGLFEAGGALLSSLVDQSRYATSDLMLATNANVYSRFILTPQRDGLIGAAALASAGLGAFIGFACRDFMRHDYLLGRKNCRDYLLDQFALPRDNHLFDGWSAAKKDEWQIAGTDELPIIPLFGQSAAPPVFDAWPKGRLDPERYRDAIARRYQSVVDRAVDGSFLVEVITDAVAAATKGAVAEYAVAKMRKALRDSDLD